MLFIPLNEAQEELIKKEEFYQPDDVIDEDVTQLIEWLTKQPHLPNITDRKWLTHFIKSCKYNLQKSKQIIETYCIARAKYPEFYGCITQEDIEIIQKMGYRIVLPKRTPDGHRVMYNATSPKADSEKVDFTTSVKYMFAILDLQLMTEPLHTCITIHDMKNVKLSQILSISPTTIKNFMKCVHEAFPYRQTSIHFINPPSFIGRVYTFVKLIVPDKLKDRIYIHNTLEELYEHVPRDYLPDSCGGNAGNIDEFQKNMFDFVLSKSKLLEERPKADLSKLPDNTKPDEMEGTFKKLQID